MRLIRPILLIDGPEFAADFIPNARTSQQLVEVLKVNLDAAEPFVIVHNVLGKVLVDHGDDLTC